MKQNSTYNDQLIQLQKDAICVLQLKNDCMKLAKKIGKNTGLEQSDLQELVKDSKELNNVAYKLLKATQNDICAKCGQVYPNPLCKYEC